MAHAARCVVIWAACLVMAGCNQLFGIERLKPAAAAGAAAGSRAGAGAPALPDEDAGS